MALRPKPLGQRWGAPLSVTDCGCSDSLLQRASFVLQPYSQVMVANFPSMHVLRDFSSTHFDVHDSTGLDGADGVLYSFSLHFPVFVSQPYSQGVGIITPQLDPQIFRSSFKSDEHSDLQGFSSEGVLVFSSEGVLVFSSEGVHESEMQSSRQAVKNGAVSARMQIR